jgi:hypothetical protein
MKLFGNGLESIGFGYSLSSKFAGASKLPGQSVKVRQKLACEPRLLLTFHGYLRMRNIERHFTARK